MLKHFTALFIILALLPFASFAAGSDTLVIMPFENVSGHPEYNWIGESFAAALGDALDKPGLVVIRSDERNVAYKQEGLSPSAILTRATMIKIAERAGANLVVIGTYRIADEREKETAAETPPVKKDGKAKDNKSAPAPEKKVERTISITARVIDIREGRLLGEFNIGGNLFDLQRFQGQLAYEILYKHNSALPFSRDDIITQATVAPVGAFENFIKGTLTRDRKAQIDFLERAIKEFNDKAKAYYIPAMFELGRIHYEAGEYKEALEWLAKIGDKEPRYEEAQFYSGVAQNALGQLDQAIASQTKLAIKLPLYEVYNNIGALYLKQKQYPEALNHLQPAAEVAPRDTDVLFNLGYAYYLTKEYAKAAGTLRQEIERRPDDGEAYYVLSKALAALGDRDAANDAANQAKRLLTTYAQWETKGAPVLARLKTTFSKANYYRFKRDQDERLNAVNANNTQQLQADQLLEKARNAFFGGRDEETLAVIGNLLQIAPQNYDAHLLMARVFERRGDFDRAMNALKAALFWNPRLGAAHVLAGRIAVLKNDCANAENSLSKALQFDPTDQDALALKRLIEQKCRKN
ncbi:MAG: tetratricopeptide repeat protein [Acidobacteria bacterium]|nr:tetratricopeptide repeat protein [Acidobacteriota bacterium]